MTTSPDSPSYRPAPDSFQDVPSLPDDLATPPLAYARIAYRIVARAVDSLIITGVFVALAVGTFFVFKTSASTDESIDSAGMFAFAAGISAFLIASAVTVLGWAVYETYALTKRGATPGKRLMGIRVVRAHTGAPIGLKQAALRTLIPTPLGVVLSYIPVALSVVGLFNTSVPLWRRDGRHLGDFIAATVVVTDDPAKAAHVGLGRRIAAVLVGIIYVVAGYGSVALLARQDRVTPDFSSNGIANGRTALGAASGIYKFAVIIAEGNEVELSDVILDQAGTEYLADDEMLSWVSSENKITLFDASGSSESAYVCLKGAQSDPCPDGEADPLSMTDPVE